jgi:transcriptional regulator with XRE-family HTH domain
MELPQSKKKDQDRQNFASRLSDAIQLRGVRKSALAEAANVDPGYVSKLLSGERENPSVLILRAIADTLAVHTRWLLSGEGPRDLTESEKAIAQVRLQSPEGVPIAMSMPMPLASARRRLPRASPTPSPLQEDPERYGESAEASRLHREILERLNDASLPHDEVVQQALKRRVEEYIEARKPKRKKP